jgi:hypothetical protein
MPQKSCEKHKDFDFSTIVSYFPHLLPNSARFASRRRA